MTWLSILGTLCIFYCGLYLLQRFLLSNPGKKAPLPPGPKPYFLVGNLADLPKPGEQEWTHWLEHKDLYGPISSVTIMGQTLVILNDRQATFELMEKRSAFHSSRPKQVFAGEMLGWEKSLGLMPYGNSFRAHRKNMAKTIGSHVALSKFSGIQEAEAGHFLLRLLDNPEELGEHIRKQAAAVIMKIAYGYATEPHKRDPLANLAGEAMDQFAKAGVPGAWLVDIVPALKHLPHWLPGAAFKQTAREWGGTLIELTERPYTFVKHQIDSGHYRPSVLSQLLDRSESELSLEDLDIAKCSAMSLFTAGSDTTVSSMECFFLAMVLFPGVQRKAQEEIDRVIGSTQLPGFEDRPNLPYINAIVKEVLRWHPVAPMGIPHMTTEDDIYRGYRIPKGAYLLPNIWLFTHDPTMYHDPMKFKPERFLPVEGYTPEPDPQLFSFGFGRRICPGRLLADDSLYINIAQSLAAFNINRPAVNGQEIVPEIHFLAGVVSHPAPFKAVIRPRSGQHEFLVRSIERIHPWEESDAQMLEKISY